MGRAELGLKRFNWLFNWSVDCCCDVQGTG